MSSVGSADNSPSNPADAPRKKSDDKSTESELIKKHQKEIRRLNEKHYSEIDDLQKQHTEAMDNLRSKSHTDMSEQDHKYAKDTADMRELYRKQLQDQADESQRTNTELRKSLGTELAVNKKNSDSHFQNLNEDYEHKSLAAEQSYANSIDESREMQKKSIADNRQKIQTRAERDVAAVKAERDGKVASTQKGYDNYRGYAEERFLDDAQSKNEMKKKDSDNLMDAVAHERRTAEDQKFEMREGFKEDIQKTHDFFEQTAKDERDAREKGAKNFRTGTGERLHNEVQNLKRQNEEMKEQIGQGNLKVRAEAKREQEDLGRSFQKSLNSYKDQRDMAIAGSNDREHKNIDKINRDYSEREVEMSRFYRDHEDEQNTINRGALDSLKTQDNVRVDQLKNQAETRVQHVYEISANDKEREAVLQGENHIASQRVHQDEMKELRNKVEDDKRIAVSNLHEQLQKQEVQHADRMSQVVGKYEKQIQVLKDQLEKERRTSDVSLKRNSEEMARAHKMGMDQMEEQHRNRIRQLEALHNTEIKTMNQRSDEKVNQVLAEVRKS